MVDLTRFAAYYFVARTRVAWHIHVTLPHAPARVGLHREVDPVMRLVDLWLCDNAPRSIPHSEIPKYFGIDCHHQRLCPEDPATQTLAQA